MIRLKIICKGTIFFNTKIILEENFYLPTRSFLKFIYYFVEKFKKYRYEWHLLFARKKGGKIKVCPNSTDGNLRISNVAFCFKL